MQKYHKIKVIRSGPVVEHVDDDDNNKNDNDNDEFKPILVMVISATMTRKLRVH